MQTIKNMQDYPQGYIVFASGSKLAWEVTTESPRVGID